MKKLLYSKGGLAKILTVLLVLTMAILTPVSELMVQAEEVVTEKLEEAAMPENSAGGGDEALSGSVLDSSNLEEAASPEEIETDTEANDSVSKPSPEEAAGSKEAEADSTDKNEKTDEAKEGLQDKTTDEEDITEESEEKPLAVKGSVEYFTYEGATITGLTEKGTQYFVTDGKPLEIPATNNGVTVTVIGDNAFKNAGVTGAIVFPNSITEIGTSAFEGNKGITGFNFPSNLNRIENSAFKNCGIKGELIIPNGFNWIGNEAFFGNQITGLRFPDDIKTVGPYAFANNQIEELHLGKLKEITGSRWKAELNIENRGLLSYGIFRNNKIKKLTLPGAEDGTCLWGLGVEAFANNQIEELKIPSTIKNIYFSVFENNTNLKTLEFLKNAEGNGVEQIDRKAFNNCAIEGSLEFPKNFNEMGGYSFAKNKISTLIFAKNKPITIGYLAFNENPLLETVSLPDCWPNDWTQLNSTNQKATEPEAFSDCELKNVNYMDNTHQAISKGAFRNNKLKAMNIPASIKYLAKVCDSNDLKPLEPFKDNTGWYEGTSKVALYRVKDVTAENPEYVTDNSLADGDSYVINPVLMELEFYDKEGKRIPHSDIDFTKFEKPKLKIERESIQAEIENGIDYKNFKIGDRLELAEGKFSFQGSQKNIELAGDLLKDESYGDGYVVGYKKVVLKLKYNGEIPKDPNPPVPNPPTPDPKPIPEPTPNPFIPPIIETPIESTEIEENKVPLIEPEIEEEPVILETEEEEQEVAEDLEEEEIEEDEAPRVPGEDEIEEDQTPLLNIPKTGEKLTSSGYFRLISIVMLSVVFVFTLERKKRMR